MNCYYISNEQDVITGHHFTLVIFLRKLEKASQRRINLGITAFIIQTFKNNIILSINRTKLLSDLD